MTNGYGLTAGCFMSNYELRIDDRLIPITSGYSCHMPSELRSRRFELGDLANAILLWPIGGTLPIALFESGVAVPMPQAMFENIVTQPLDSFSTK